MWLKTYMYSAQFRFDKIFLFVQYELIEAQASHCWISVALEGIVSFSLTGC